MASDMFGMDNSIFYHIGVHGSQASSRNFRISRYLLLLQCSLCNVLHITITST